MEERAILEDSPELVAARRKWRWVGRKRPAWALPPGPGQRSVGDFPRPPRIEREERSVRVELAGRIVAETLDALRVVETASPPTIYLPERDVAPGLLEQSGTEAICEWKGVARHFTLRVPPRLVLDAAWCYTDPFSGYRELASHIAFHPARVDLCALDGTVALAQPGGYYGGWITPELVGPWKGEPGTEDW